MSAKAPTSESLQALWASAYDGWISPPGSSAGAVVYLKPLVGGSESSEAATSGAWIDESLSLADYYGGLYALTAFNPMGQDKPHDVNMAQNQLLTQDVAQLCAATGGRSCYWRSFGFAADWHERGFTVAAKQEDVIALAKKYGQGAIYRFYRPATAQRVATFMRATVPVLVADTEADVACVACAKPALERANPTWQPLIDAGA